MSARSVRRFSFLLVLLAVIPVAAEEQPEPDPPGHQTTLEGQVVDPDGSPIPGAEVRLAAPFIPSKKQKAMVLTTDEDGKWEATDLEEEVGQIAADAPGFDGYSDLRFKPDGEPVVITLDPGVTVTGRVFDNATTKPIAGATVQVCEHWTRYFADNPCTELTTDADGRFETNDAGGHLAIVDAWSPRHERAKWTQPIPKVTGGEPIISGAELYLRPGGRVSGRVLDSDDKPVEGALIGFLLVTPDRRKAREFRYERFLTDSAGNYVIHGVPADLPFTLVVETDGFARSESDPLDVGVGDHRKDLTLRALVGATLLMRLTDPDGMPVHSLEFMARDAREDQEARRDFPGTWTEVEADDDGVFTLEHLTPGEFDITLRPEDQQEIRLKSVELSNAETTDLGTVTTAPGLAITGVVTDQNDEPIEEARVTVTWTDGEESSRFESTTDENGSYRVNGLPEATVQVNAWSARFVRGSPVEGTPGGDDVNISLVRFPRVSGRVVLPGGEAPQSFQARAQLEGVKVRNARERQVGQEAFEDPEGRFVLHVWKEGDVTLEILTSGMQTRRVEVSGLKNGEVQEVGKIILEPGLNVRGQVIDRETGAPIPDAMVFVTPAQSSPLPRIDRGRLGPNEAARTGPDGTFELGGQEPGLRNVLAEHLDFIQSRTELEIEPGTDVADLIIHLGHGSAVEGTVTDANDEPMGNVEVYAMNVADPAVSSRGATDGRGRYRLEGLPSGGVMVGSRGFEWQQATVTDGETAVVDLRKSAGIKVSGRVLRGQEPVDNAHVVFRGIGGRATATSDSSGNFEATLETAGRYWVRVSSSPDAPKPEASLTWIVPDGPTVNRDIVLYGGRIEGRVTDQDGAPLGGVSVYRKASQTGEISSPRISSARTDRDGQYEIRGLPVGSYEMTFTGSDYPSVQRSTEIRDEGDTARVDVELIAGAPVVGRVVDPNGIPVAGATVYAAPSGTDRMTRPVRTSGTGRFEINVPPGRVDIGAVGGGWAPAVVEGLEAEAYGTDGEIVVRLGMGGTARVVATRQDGTPVAGAMLVVAPDRLLLARLAMRKPPQPTDAAGVSLQPRLAVGRHKVYLVTMKGDAQELPVTVEVTEGEEATVEVVVP